MILLIECPKAMKASVRKVIRRLIAATVSSFFLAVLFAIIATILNSRGAVGEGSVSFPFLTINFLIYIIPAYVLGGIPFSYAADWIMDKLPSIPLVRYAIGLLLYAVGGVLVIWLYLAVLANEKWDVIWLDLNSFSWVGAAASLVFFHISYAIEYVFRNREETVL